jgi:ATP-dependent DNA ligase
MIDLTKFKPQLVGEGDLGIFLYNNDGVFVEPKIDGVRILCLKRGATVQFFARSGTDWTKRFGSVGDEIVKGIHADNIILDGEMAVVENSKVLSSNSVLQKKLPDGQRFVYFVFDVLQIGEEFLYKGPLLSRKQHLGLLIEDNEHLSLVPFFCTNTIVDIQEFYKKMIEKGVEGIVVKNCSPYHPGARYNWIKKKPLRTVDLQVINRRERKDNLGWIYTLAEDSKVIGTASSKLDILDGQIVEVGYDMKYPKEDSYRLRFPKILRVREDK